VITVNGTAAAETFNATATLGVVNVSGLGALVRIGHSESANDSLILNGGAGTDTFTVGAGVSSLITVTTNQ
jgi:hypothetical protein